LFRRRIAPPIWTRKEITSLKVNWESRKGIRRGQVGKRSEKSGLKRDHKGVR
jgi:hypothetical protein